MNYPDGMNHTYLNRLSATQECVIDSLDAINNMRCAMFLANKQFIERDQHLTSAEKNNYLEIQAEIIDEHYKYDAVLGLNLQEGEEQNELDIYDWTDLLAYQSSKSWQQNIIAPINHEAMRHNG